MKAQFVKNWFGRFLLLARRDAEMRLVSGWNPEQAGMHANAIIADRLVAQLCPPGGIFVDVGAQFGAIFSMARSSDPTLQVFAFEAESIKAQALKETFPDVTVFDLAVGPEEGEATFYLNPKASGYNSLVPSDELVPVTVRVAPIDDLLPGQKADVIKIDIEGAELGALRGAEKTVTTSHPTIMFECVLPERNALGYAAEDIWQWLTERDYGIFVPDRLAHDAPPMTKGAFVDAQQYPFRAHNYFAVHASKRTAVRDRAREILKVLQD